MKYNILVVYGYRDFPLRSTSWNHLYSHQQYSGHNCFYINLAVNKIPHYITNIKFDLIIFDTLFFVRFKRNYFLNLMKKAAVLKKSSAIKVMIPQDEFINTDLLCRFASEFNIDHIFSVAPETEWSKIYKGVDRGKTRLHKVLTGYLDDRTIQDVAHLTGETVRNVDIGYCAAAPLFWHGRHGMLKSQIGQAFLSSELAEGLQMNIITPKGHAFLGNDWFRFLLRCKYTLGVESGTSILDEDGTISARTESYVRDHPQASFEEVEAICFPGADGSFNLFALSPRHLEACVTRTCQILTEGDYDGVLKPWVHYLPLKKDFSNLSQIIELVRNDSLRSEIVERAYHDVVASKIYSYANYVGFVLNLSIGTQSGIAQNKAEDRFALFLNKYDEKLSWFKVRVLSLLRRGIRSTARLMKKA